MSRAHTMPLLAVRASASWTENAVAAVRQQGMTVYPRSNNCVAMANPIPPCDAPVTTTTLFLLFLLSSLRFSSWTSMAGVASENCVCPHIVDAAVETSVPRSNESRRRLLLPLSLSEFSSRHSNTSVAAELLAVARMCREVSVLSLLPLLLLVLIIVITVIQSVSSDNTRTKQRGSEKEKQACAITEKESTGGSCVCVVSGRLDV